MIIFLVREILEYKTPFHHVQILYANSHQVPGKLIRFYFLIYHEPVQLSPDIFNTGIYLSLHEYTILRKLCPILCSHGSFMPAAFTWTSFQISGLYVRCLKRTFQELLYSSEPSGHASSLTHLSSHSSPPWSPLPSR